MAIELNHTVVPAHDKVKSAKFFARIFGLSFDGEMAHFAPVRVNDSLTLDFDNRSDFRSHHYAFKVSEEEFDQIFGFAGIDEPIDLSVAVASQIRKDAASGRLLIEAVDGHHREELFDRPVIRRALEDRKIAVVGICEPVFEIGEILGHLGQLSEKPEDLLAALREQVFDLSLASQVEVAQRKHRRRFFFEQQRVVVGLLDVFDRGIAPDFREIAQHLGIVIGDEPVGSTVTGAYGVSA